MRARSRPAITSFLLVAGISIGVFVSSSFALQGVSTGAAEPRPHYQPFETLSTHGVVEVKDRPNARLFRLGYKGQFTLSPNQVGEFGMGNLNVLPDIIVEQQARYPTFSAAGDFIGPVGLPFRSQELALRVRVTGECFRPDQGGWVLDRGNPGCVKATLSLDGETFLVSGLLVNVNGRVTSSDNAEVWDIRISAQFKDPGYGFPAASIGQGSRTLLRFGPFGGSTEVVRVRFDG